MTHRVTDKSFEDWRVMRNYRLRQLKKALRNYTRYVGEEGKRKLTAEEAEARWKREAELLAGIHDAAHRLGNALATDMLLTRSLCG